MTYIFDEEKDEEKEDIKAEDTELNNEDGDDEEGEEGEEGEGKAKSGWGLKKILIFVVLPILVLGGAGAGLYFSGILNSVLGIEESHESEDGNEHASDKGHEKKKKASKGGHGEESGGGHNPYGVVFLEIPDMRIDLISDSGRARNLLLSVQLELESETDKEAVSAVLPRIVDQFQTYLRELRVSDLRGSAGIYRLQLELLNRVNIAADPIEVSDVLIQEILIQ